MKIALQIILGVVTGGSGFSALLVLALAMSLPSGGANAQQLPVPRPEAVTDSAIARGKEVFHGPANCATCHGEDGRGTELGPNLADAKWIHGTGTYPEIVARVLHGQARRESSTGRPMPMRGWSPASDASVAAVAAYVWWLSHASKNRN